MHEQMSQCSLELISQQITGEKFELLLQFTSATTLLNKKTGSILPSDAFIIRSDIRH